MVVVDLPAKMKCGHSEEVERSREQVTGGPDGGRLFPTQESEEGSTTIIKESVQCDAELAVGLVLLATGSFAFVPPLGHGWQVRVMNPPMGPYDCRCPKHRQVVQQPLGPIPATPVGKKLQVGPAGPRLVEKK